MLAFALVRTTEVIATPHSTPTRLATASTGPLFQSFPGRMPVPRPPRLAPGQAAGARRTEPFVRLV
jgi:hypothetical protein